jgi:hypothetical protein
MSRVARAARMTLGAAIKGARSPSDLVLTIRIGLFVLRLPSELGKRDVTTFLRELRAAPRPSARDVDASVERIRRIAAAVLSLPRFWHWNTCYVRALILYRFVDARDREMQLHLGIEQRGPEERLHGHAWLTLAGEVLEAPAEGSLATLREVPLDDIA